MWIRLKGPRQVVGCSVVCPEVPRERIGVSVCPCSSDKSQHEPETQRFSNDVGCGSPLCIRVCMKADEAGAPA